MCLNLLKIKIIIPNAMAASAAAIPMIKSVKDKPYALSGDVNLLKATKLRPAPFIMSSMDMSMPIRVLL
jgi:hypothetical protein